MPELAKFSLAGGGSVHVDVDEVPRVTPVSRHGRILDAKATFETALGEVRHAAVVALTEFRAMASQPDEVEITFGVRLDAEVGAVIAKTGMAGNFEVKLTWRSNVRDAPDGAVSLPETAELQRPDPVS